MTGRTLRNQSFTGGVVALLVSVVGVGVPSAAIAQSISVKPLNFQMAQAASLAGNWRLANMTTPGFPTPMLPSTDLTADFTGGRVSGSGGCNRFNGSYSTKGSQLSIGPLASTFKACEESVMNQETTYLKALEAAERYEVSDQGLQIFYKTEQGTGVLRFTSLSVRGLW